MSFAKSYLFLAIVSFLCVESFAQIPNAGFENWSNGDPNGWVTSNINGIVVNVTQNTTSHSGTYAVQGNVVQFFTSALQPVLQVGPGARGFAYNQRPYSVRGYYKFFPQGGDRFAVNVALFRGGSEGTVVANAAMAIIQGTSSFVQFNAPFVYLNNEIPDTCILQFQIVGPVTGTDFHVGSYFVLDDLDFQASSDVQQKGGEIPADFALEQNYPNPFNPSTTIEFSIPRSAYTTLKVYDMLGKEVASLVDEQLNAGTFKTTLDGSSLASGMYTYVLRAEDFVQSKKLLLIR